MTCTLGQTELFEIIRLIPGYDPFDTAQDCWFDERAAQLAIDFFAECLTHIEGAMAGRPFVLEPWEKAIVANLFGWKRPDGSRRYREGFIYVPRKNGKTPLVAGIADYVLFCDAEVGQQDYIAAGESDQAGLLFRHAAGMVRAEPELDARCEIYGEKQTSHNRIIYKKEDGSFLKVISSEAYSKHGGNPHFQAVDELHAVPDRRLVEVLQTGMSSANRLQPMMLYATTADYNHPSICNDIYKYACLVRDNGGDPEKPGYDPCFLPVIYEASIDDDWTDEAVWAKANPNLGVSVSLDYLKAECQKAQEQAWRENIFKRLHLNIITEQSVRWMPLDKWDACGIEFDPKELLGRPCWAGLDLSSKIDITGLVLLFPPLNEEDIYKVLPYFWVPGDSLEARYRRDRVPYPVWQKKGFIEQTTGNVVDYSFIRNRVKELGKLYSIQDIGFDPWNATHIAQQLADEDGFGMTEFRQGFISMNEPTKELYRLILSGKISHNKNPVLHWMAGNVAVKTDPAGNIKPDKEKSTEKIDGIVALIMALGRAMANTKKESIYEKRGPLIFEW